MENLIGNVDSFLSKIFEQIKELNIDISEMYPDHICYRTSSEEEYKKVKEAFFNYGDLLIESDVNGRLISTFKFNKPILFEQYKIDLIEIPAPKKGAVYESGLEHIELVTKEDLNSIKEKYSHLSFDTSAMSKELNAELKLKLKDGLSIKFHNQSLEKVIEIEKALLLNK